MRFRIAICRKIYEEMTQRRKISHLKKLFKVKDALNSLIPICAKGQNPSSLVFSRRLLWKVEVNIQYLFNIIIYVLVTLKLLGIDAILLILVFKRFIDAELSNSFRPLAHTLVQYIIYGNLSHASSAASPKTQCAFCCKHTAVCIKGRKSPGKFPFNGPSPVLCLSISLSMLFVGRF